MKLEIISKFPTSVNHGRPLLFVHGSWHGAWCFEKYFLPYFAQNGYPAHALSLRGHGKSECKGKLPLFRIADYVDDVAEVVHTFPEKPVVIGHSLGGFVVQKYLETHPAFAGVLLATAPPYGMFLACLNFARMHPLLFAKDFFTCSSRHLVSTSALVKELLFSDNTPQAEVEDCFSRLQDESFLAYLDMLFVNLIHPSKISAPLLVMGAEKDKVIRLHEVAATARAYNTKASIVPGIGHNMMLDTDWQNVADTILCWFKKENV